MAETEIVPHGAPAGRPCSYTQPIADMICDRLSLGESLRSICADEAMPGQTTVFRWLDRDDDIGEAFRKQYARARERQADSLFDECTDIADDARNDWMEKNGKDGEPAGYQFNSEHVQRSKLRIEQRRWHAGKLRPTVYGDKLDLTSGGERLASSADDAAARVAALLAVARTRRDEAGG